MAALSKRLSKKRLAQLKLAHSPAARKKAIATLAHLTTLRQRMAAKYNERSSAFQKDRLLDTLKRRGLPLSAVPVDLFKPFSSGQRGILLEQRKNGGAPESEGTSIPLDAIPEKRETKSNGAAPTSTKNRGHPNAELIVKVIDLLGKPETNDSVSERLLAVLDKLVT